MANLISTADGNFTAAATWATVDTTHLITTSVSATTLTTSPLDSAVFQPGAITVDGVALKLNARAAGTPTNKITVTLRNSTGAVDVKTVIANVSDLPPCANADLDGGWHFFKFDAPVLLLAATNYVIRLQLDSTSTAVTFFTTGVANNWLHALRTTTTQAPAAGDDLHIMGELSAATNPATASSRVVTMDSVATTIYGQNANAANELPAVGISNRGTLSYAFAGSTNYYLKLAGGLVVYSGGTLTIGTVANPIPRTSTAVLEFSTASSKLYALRVHKGATFIAQGLSRTAAKNVWACNLTSNLAAAGTVCNVDADTGWLLGDEVAIATTTRTAADTEVKALVGDAGASSFTLSAGASAAHGGVAPVVAEIILITRNVKIRPSNLSFQVVAAFLEGATIDTDWVEWREVVLTLWTTALGSSSFMYSSWRMDGAAAVAVAVNGGATDNYTFQYMGFYGTTTGNILTVPSTTGTAWVVDHVIAMTVSGSSLPFTFTDLGGTFDYLTSVGGQGSTFADANAAGVTFPNTPHLTAHGGASNGLLITGRFINCTFANITSWRNAGTTSLGPSSATDYMVNVTITSLIAFGHIGANFTFSTGIFVRCRILGGTIAGDTSFASTHGLKFTAGTTALFHEWTIDNVTFGQVTGIYTTHTTADVDFVSSTQRIQCTFRNCYFGSTVKWTGYTLMMQGSFIASARHQQLSSGSHQYTTALGTITADTLTFKTASPSEKLAPASASLKLESGPKQVALNMSAGCTVTVWVRKDATYNGNAPRLVQKADPAIGQNADAVLDTFTVGVDTWEQLSGTVPALSDNGAATLVVDCDGTAGGVFVDDWAVS